MFGCRRLRRPDDGFTLVEVMVALGILAVVLVSAIPMLVSTLRSTVTVKLDTQAKNLAQQRVDQMRDLQYHVDRQNGPFIDLLDLYYTNLSSTPSVITSGGSTLTGQFVSTGGGTGGEPTAPFYRVTTSSTIGTTTFNEMVDSQFLAPGGSALALSSLGSYNSQVQGLDRPPSLLLGVTVIVSWTDAGKAKSFQSYTRITDARPQQPVIQSQSRAVAVDAASTAADGTTLDLQAGVANLDGAQSSGSSVQGYVSGAVASRTGSTPVTGQVAQFSLPLQNPTTSGSTSPQDAGSCNWYGFSTTGTNDVTASLGSGLPKAPSDVDLASPPSTVSGYIAANGGGSCGQLSYSNLAGGGIAQTATPASTAFGSAPYVAVPDTVGGNAPAITGAGYVTSNVSTSVPTQTKSGARASMVSPVVVFPHSPESGGSGLVKVTLTSASVDCVSGTSAVLGTVVGKYSLTVSWWGKSAADAASGWHTTTWTYDSTLATPLSVSGTAWNPSAYTLTTSGVTLDQVVTMTAPAAVATGASTGLRGFPNGVVTLTTAPTLSNESAPGYSAINVRLGKLTCVADDLR